MSQPTRTSRVLVLLGGALLALSAACGSDSSSDAAPSSSSATAAASATPTATPAPSSSAVPGTSETAPSPTSVPGGAATTPTDPDPGSGGGSAGGGSGGGGDAGAPITALPGLSVDPAKSQSFLDALHAGGVPAQYDQVSGLIGPLVCQASAQGQSDQQILSQLAAEGQAFSTGTSLSPDQLSQLFLTAAKQYYC